MFDSPVQEKNDLFLRIVFKVFNISENKKHYHPCGIVRIITSYYHKNKKHKIMKTKIIHSIIAIAFILFTCIGMQSCGSKKESDNTVTEIEKTEALKQDKNEPTTSEAGSVNQDEASYAKAKGVKDKATTTTDNLQRSQEEIPKEQAKVEKIPNKIIKTADTKFQVKDMDDTRKTILSLVKKSNGYISSEFQTTNSYQIENTMVIRIKSDGFDNLVDEILKQSIYTDSKKITAADVTEEYVDLAARLKSKKEVEKQYAEILKKAYSIYDILQVEQQLRMIREEIDAFEGRLKYLDDRVDYSTINLNFYEKLDFVCSPSRESGFFYKMGKAFSGGWNVVLNIFIGLVYLWPFLLGIMIGLFFLLRYIKKSRKK